MDREGPSIVNPPDRDHIAAPEPARPALARRLERLRPVVLDRSVRNDGAKSPLDTQREKKGCARSRSIFPEVRVSLCQEGRYECAHVELVSWGRRGSLPLYLTLTMALCGCTATVVA
jgi:hypothetical protein